MLALTTLALLMMGAVLTLPVLARRTMKWRCLHDKCFSAAMGSADNSASRILQFIAQVLGKRGEGADSPASKQQRLEEASDTISQFQEPQVFHWI